MTDAAMLLSAQRAFVIAPAGCGKTQLIADSVRLDATHRSLILTHTHAGVEALRRRLKRVGADTATYHVDTIAGWGLRLATALPTTSGIVTERPAEKQWDEVYRATGRLLRIDAIKAVVRASFDAVYVDEYQDCSTLQHEMVLGLAGLLPTRILGDPLQGIFKFRDSQLVDWQAHVAAAFAELPPLATPHRWAGTNPGLGRWLGVVREKLEGGQPIDVREAPEGVVRFVTLPGDPRERGTVQREVCLSATCPPGQTLVAIHNWEPQCHDVARHTRGKFRSLETMECDALFHAAKVLDDAPDSGAVAQGVFDFACLCLTHVKTKLVRTAARVIAGRALQRNREYEHREQLDALAEVAATGSLASARIALLVLARTKDAAYARHELFHEMLNALQEHAAGRHGCLRDAAVRCRDRTRRTGRTLGRYIVGRTLLVKGLEFDHALVLDASELNREHLYVALTRASRSLTLLGVSAVLDPR